MMRYKYKVKPLARRLRRKPTLERWKGYHMANTDKWYFAYTIDGDTITIVDSCHAQNMK